MAIDLTCFTTLAVPDLQHELDRFQRRHSHVFPAHYVLYKAHSLDRFDKEISNEYGLDSKSYFMVAVNNKALEISTDEMASMIKSELGKENVIILLNGEDLI